MNSAKAKKNLKKPKKSNKKIATGKELLAKKNRPQYNPDKEKIEGGKEKDAKRKGRSLITALIGLKQLQARIEASIEAIDAAQTPIEFYRAWLGVNNAPSFIHCPDKRGGQVDPCVCNYVCRGKCTYYTSSQFICKALRCEDEQVNKCQDEGVRCKAFGTFKTFVNRYILAYAIIAPELPDDEESLETEEEIIESKKQPEPPKEKKKKKRKAV